MSRALLRHALCSLVVCSISVSAVSAQELNWAQKMFESLNHDFGDVARGADTVHRIKLTNIYKETVHISNVSTTCGCTAAKPSKSTLASREEAYIEITMDTRKFSRKKESNVVINFDSPFQAEVRIPIAIYIRTDVVVEPGGVNFGAVEAGSMPNRTVSIAYAGRPDWKILNVRPSNPNLTANLVEVTRANGQVRYNLEVGLKPELTVGDFRGQILLQTDDAESTQIPILVEARVESDVTITPDVIALGNLAPGATKTVNVVIRGKKPFGIDKLECESETEAFKVRLPKDVRPVHVVPLTVTAPEKPGALAETFSLTIAGRPQPVTFKAYGTITPAGASN